MSKISLLPIFVAGATLPVIKRTAQSSGRDTSNLCRPFRGRATEPSTFYKFVLINLCAVYTSFPSELTLTKATTTLTGALSR